MHIMRCVWGQPFFYEPCYCHWYNASTEPRLYAPHASWSGWGWLIWNSSDEKAQMEESDEDEVKEEQSAFLTILVWFLFLTSVRHLMFSRLRQNWILITLQNVYQIYKLDKTWFLSVFWWWCICFSVVQAECKLCAAILNHFLSVCFECLTEPEWLNMREQGTKMSSGPTTIQS